MIEVVTVSTERNQENVMPNQGEFQFFAHLSGIALKYVFLGLCYYYVMPNRRGCFHYANLTVVHLKQFECIKLLAILNYSVYFVII